MRRLYILFGIDYENEDEEEIYKSTSYDDVLDFYFEIINGDIFEEWNNFIIKEYLIGNGEIILVDEIDPEE